METLSVHVVSPNLWMTIMSLEKKIQKNVVEYARKKNFIALKVNVGSQRGWPDYVLIDPDGWHVWMEFKKPGEEPEPLQIHRAIQLTERGILVYVIDSEKQGKDAIDVMVSARVPEESHEDAPLPGERRIISGPGTREN